MAWRSPWRSNVQTVEQNDPSAITASSAPADTIVAFSAARLDLWNTGYFHNPVTAFPGGSVADAGHQAADRHGTGRRGCLRIDADALRGLPAERHDGRPVAAGQHEELGAGAVLGPRPAARSSRSGRPGPARRPPASPRRTATWATSPRAEPRPMRQVSTGRPVPHPPADRRLDCARTSDMHPSSLTTKDNDHDIASSRHSPGPRSWSTAGLLAGSGGAALAAAPPWEPDPSSIGGLTFYDAAGNQITGGNINDAPFATYVQAGAAGRAGDTKATLFGYLPKNGVAIGAWTGEALSGSPTYPNASAPGAAERVGAAAGHAERRRRDDRRAGRRPAEHRDRRLPGPVPAPAQDVGVRPGRPARRTTRPTS